MFKKKFAQCCLQLSFRRSCNDEGASRGEVKAFTLASTTKPLVDAHYSVTEGGGMSCFPKNKQKTKPTALSVLEISFQPEHAFPSLGET